MSPLYLPYISPRLKGPMEGVLPDPYPPPHPPPHPNPNPYPNPNPNPNPYPNPNPHPHPNPDQVLAQANLTKADIHRVEVVGGATRIPRVKEVANHTSRTSGQAYSSSSGQAY